MENTGSSVFVNTIITKQFPNGPKVSAEFQIIIALNKNNEWVVDACDGMDVTEIEMFGETITEGKSKNEVMVHFSNMGINLWDKMEKDLNEAIVACGGAVQFVKEQTGIVLPTKTKQNGTIELTRQELEYVLIMNDLKQQFGSLGYYNDKRKTTRRIKIYSGPTVSIHRYMYEKYPHIQTYFNFDPRSGGLCFRLPL
jgi:hypothetical protein